MLELELNELKAALQRLEQRIAHVETNGVATNSRLDILHADMRQRFRTLNERVASIESRLAA